MNSAHSTEGLKAATLELNRHGRRKDGASVVRNLTEGLDALREAFYMRIHRDVQQDVGHDSMLMPVSEIKAEQQAEEEIELYQTAEAAAVANRHGYATGADDWFLTWLGRLRLADRTSEPELQQRLLAYYRLPSQEQRALALTNALAAALPASMKAPLVLFRLAPLAVEIVVALAFEDRTMAAALRREQLSLLPAIGYCQRCRGKLLPPGEPCEACGNPLWKHKWLTAID